MEMTPRLSFKMQQEADPRSLGLMERIISGINNLGIYVRNIKVNFPSVYQVFGAVDVDTIKQMPPVTVTNFPDLQSQLRELGKSIEDMQVKTLAAFKASKTEFPTKFNVDNEVKIESFNELLEGIEELKKGFNILINQEKKGFGDNPMEVNIANFPPTMVPTPVTHVSINGLTGFAKSNAVTVSTSLTPLPGTPLSNRRSVVVYNNSATNAFYIGGSDVTAANGIPVPAGTFSPSFDASPGLVIYGITASSTADARVLELSDENSGR